VREVVKHGEHGYLTEVGDIEAMARYGVEILTNPFLAAEMGRKGREAALAALYKIEIAKSPIGVAIDAFADSDPAYASALADMDDVMDDLTKSLFRAILTSVSPDESGLQTAVQLSLVGRFYERVADHAVSIADRVNFIVTGVDEPFGPDPVDDDRPPQRGARLCDAVGESPELLQEPPRRANRGAVGESGQLSEGVMGRQWWPGHRGTIVTWSRWWSTPTSCEVWSPIPVGGRRAHRCCSLTSTPGGRGRRTPRCPSASQAS